MAGTSDNFSPFFPPGHLRYNNFIMSLPSTIWFILIMGVASFLQGITGFGFALVTAPLAIHLTDPVTLIFSFTLISLVLNGYLAITIKSPINSPLIKPIVLGSLLGLPVGYLALTQLPLTSFQSLLGITVIIFAILLLNNHLTIKATRHVSLAVGFIVGVLHLALGVNGPPVALYLSGLKLKPIIQRRTLAIIFVCISLFSIPFFINQNLISSPRLLLSLYTLPAVLIGAYCGRRLASHVSPQLFRVITFILIIISGLSLLI